MSEYDVDNPTPRNLRSLGRKTKCPREMRGAGGEVTNVDASERRDIRL